MIFGGTEGIITWLRSKHLLSSSETCACGRAMRKRSRMDLSDGIIWYCTGCKTTRSIRHGSFFVKSRLTLQQWLVLMYWWAREYPAKDATEEAKVNKNTATTVYRWLREVCSTKLLQAPIILGGPGVICEIDESMFKHKPKVREIIRIL